MITQKSLAGFFRQFATLIGSGIDVSRALNSLEARNRYNQIGKMVSGIRTRIQQGSTLAGAMAHYPNFFTPTQLMIIEVGEKGGRLAENLRSIAEELEQNWRVKLKLITNLIYPVILLHTVIIIPAISTWFLQGFIPFLKRVFSFIIPLYGFFFVIWLVIHTASKSTGLKRLFQGVGIHLLVIGPLMKRLAVARFFSSLGILYHSGADIVRSLETAAEGCGNLIIKDAILTIVPEVRQGQTLTLTLSKIPYFPPETIDMVSAGEESGKLDEIFPQLAKNYQTEANTAIQRLVIIMPILLYLAIVGYIAYYVISFYIGYFTNIFTLSSY